MQWRFTTDLMKMSNLSKQVLKSQHSGVHEQFDCVYAATLAFKAINEDLGPVMSRSLRSNQKGVIKAIMRQKMDEIGLRRGWFGITQGLCMYAFEFVELLVQNDPFCSDITIDDYFDVLLYELAGELDAEFSKTKMADSIGYLKRRLVRIGVFR